MRILIITPYVPSLIRVRSFHFVRALAEVGHEVTVVALGVETHTIDSENADRLRELCKAVYVVPHSRRESLISCSRLLMSGVPLWAAYCMSSKMDRELSRVIKLGQFDIAHIEHLRGAHYVGSVGSQLPAIYDSVDCITDLQRQFMKSADRGILARTVSASEYLRLRRYEPVIAARFNRVIITSRQDADNLIRLSHRQGLRLAVDVIPNGVDLNYFAPSQHDETVPGSIVFTGKMSYTANHDAAMYFAKSIFPEVRRQVPGATFTIAGSAPSKSLMELGRQPNSGITVTGKVADLRPYILQAAVVVCPLRIGAGIQNKVLEAMALQKPVVSTELAASSLDSSVINKGIVVAADTQDFAKQTVRLLHDRKASEIVAEGGRRYVEDMHDWKHIGDRLTDIYRDVIRDNSQIAS